MTKFLLIAISLFILPSLVIAADYGHYDVKRVFHLHDIAGKKSVTIDNGHLERILEDLRKHAGNYPPTFDSLADRERAVRDVTLLSNILATLAKGDTADRDILLQAGKLNSIGHNLDIPASMERASTAFQRLLKDYPDDPRGNYHYGVFLGNSGRAKESIPYLEKAVHLRVSSAVYALGMAHIVLGKHDTALMYLKQYLAKYPDDKSVALLIEAVRSGKPIVNHTLTVDADRMASKGMKPSEVFNTKYEDGYRVSSRSNRPDMLMIEMLPKGQTKENWTDRLMIQTNFRFKSVKPEIFQKKMVTMLKNACNFSETWEIFRGKDNGYSCIIWFSKCTPVKITGKPLYILFKAIQGNNAFYIVEKDWKTNPDRADFDKWVKLVRASVLCDAKRPEHPCPKNEGARE